MNILNTFSLRAHLSSWYFWWKCLEAFLKHLLLCYPPTLLFAWPITDLANSKYSWSTVELYVMESSYLKLPCGNMGMFIAFFVCWHFSTTRSKHSRMSGWQHSLSWVEQTYMHEKSRHFSYTGSYTEHITMQIHAILCHNKKMPWMFVMW